MAPTMRGSLCVLAGLMPLFCGTEAFRGPSLAPRRLAVLRADPKPALPDAKAQDIAPEGVSGAGKKALEVAAVAVLMDFVMPLSDAMAKGGEYGILEGKAAALVHPAIMLSLLATTAYTGLLGWNWRRVRTIGNEISELKAGLPQLSDGSKAKSPLSKAIQELSQKKEAEGADASAIDADIALCNGAMAIDEQITQLTATRKELTKEGPAKFRDKHFATSSALLGWGVTFAIGACFNTYSRAGKLFPGPHLYAGAAITAMWALAAACVPQMQQGKDWARSLHIGLNMGVFGLFLWQVQSGLGILDKVWNNVPWFPSVAGL